jgi:ubiquinone/menaquinone biosynthesis C-methylase UbiE
MDYEKIYTENYFSGKDSFFYKATGGYKDFKVYFDNLAAAYAPFFEGGELLDIGCAYGFLLERFQGKGSLYGHDVSAHAIEVAKTRLPNALFSVGNAGERLPFGDESFNGVMMTDVIEHLTRADQEQALAEMTRILRPGGTLYITTPNHNWVRKLFYAIPDKMEHHIGLLHIEALRELCRRHGLEIASSWAYLHGLFKFRFPEWLGPEAAVVARKPLR